MLKMVDGTGIIGVDTICPLGVSTPQPPNYDRVELEGTGILVLPNSLDAPLERLELGGKTEQVTTTGKNLANPSEFVIGTIAGDTGNIIGLKQYIATGYIPVIPGKRYSTSCGNKFLAHAIFACDKEKTKINTVINMSSEMPEGAAYIRLSYKKIDMTNVTESDMEELKKVCMVNEGSTVLPYEPYTGGKPSPSPEYPQEIKSVGKWNDEKQKYEVDVKVSNCGYLQKGSYADKIRPLPLEKGKTYRIYVDVKSAVVNAGILNEERTFANSGQLYAYYNSRGYPISSTGVVSGICRLPNSLYRGYTFTVTVDGLFLYQGVNANILNTDNAYVAYDFIKKVDISSPYTEKESVVLTSDRPITKWDKLVEQGGQIGWLYKSKIIDGFDGQSSNITLGGKQGEVQHFSVVFTDVPNGIGNGDIYVDRYRAIAISYTKAEFGICCNWNSGVKFFSAPNENVTTVQEFKTWLAENPLVLVYETTSTEFVPLPQSEQNAIRALKTYYPTTVITADGGELDPDIKLTYRKEI